VSSLPWLWLAAAGVLEVVWVVLLKRADGFSRLGYGALCLAAMAASVWCMSQSLRTLPMGTVYAVWTGLGTAGALFWGIAMEGEPLTVLRIVCVCLILAGVAGLRLAL
jgi:quaternary ammonium compound-resistance protein SugE